jgi:hypothetical protein
VTKELMDVEVSELISAVRALRTQHRASHRDGYRRGRLVPGATTMDELSAASGCPNPGGLLMNAGRASSLLSQPESGSPLLAVLRGTVFDDRPRHALGCQCGHVEEYEISEEPTGQTYERLLDWLFASAEKFEIENRQPTVSQLGQAGIRPDLSLLVDHASRASYTSRAKRLRFRADQAARTVLAEANGLYSVGDVEFFRDADCSERLLATIAHEKDAWLVLSDGQLRDLQRAIPELQLDRQRPLPAKWEIKVTISASLPDEQTGRHVGREIRALVNASSAEFLRSVFVSGPDEFEGGICKVDVEVVGTRAALLRLEEQIVAAVEAAGGRLGETDVWETREPHT